MHNVLKQATINFVATKTVFFFTQIIVKVFVLQYHLSLDITLLLGCTFHNRKKIIITNIPVIHSAVKQN